MHRLKQFTLLAVAAVAPVLAIGNTISESQQQFIKRYENQKNITPVDEALLNTDPEPNLTEGFVDLYNGKDLTGWTPIGGTCTFEATPDAIIGTTVVGSPSTYLSTEKDDYTDFIFTAELKWEVNGNSGIMFRAKRLDTAKGQSVTGPQAEMEGDSGKRRWSGGIYGQSAGKWRYPLWLDAHEEARGAIKKGEWNRITIMAVGDTVKTWVNGIPAAHWKTDEFKEGFFSLQVHSGKQGTIHFRNIKVKEVAAGEDLFSSNDFSKWTQLDGTPVAGGWSISNGIVERSGKRPGCIISKKNYRNFDLSFDWKISPGGNSGVKYRTRKRTGLEYQILDDSQHEDGKNPLTQAASLYALFPAASDKPLAAVGEWNRGRIVVNGDRTEHWLNGQKVLSAPLDGKPWKKAVKKSKYKRVKDFGQVAGPILLQDHKDLVWYRNVHIKEL